jgi:hypothetical protein
LLGSWARENPSFLSILDNSRNKQWNWQEQEELEFRGTAILSNNQALVLSTACCLPGSKQYDCVCPEPRCQRRERCLKIFSFVHHWWTSAPRNPQLLGSWIALRVIFPGIYTAKIFLTHSRCGIWGVMETGHEAQL